MADIEFYSGTHTGQQIDTLLDTIPNKASRDDLTPISVTGNKNNSGDAIAKFDYFYKDGVLCQAISTISSNATLTLNTNYVVASNGVLLRTTGTITAADGFTLNTSNSYCRERGNVVTVSATISGSISAGTTTIGTISGVKMPPVILRTVSAKWEETFAAGANRKLIMGGINTSGNLSVWSNEALSGFFEIFATYVL